PTFHRRLLHHRPQPRRRRRLGRLWRRRPCRRRDRRGTRAVARCRPALLSRIRLPVHAIALVPTHDERTLPCRPSASRPPFSTARRLSLLCPIRSSTDSIGSSRRPPKLSRTCSATGTRLSTPSTRRSMTPPLRQEFPPKACA